MKLLLVDGHYYAYRSFFAIRNLSNSRGEPTNAVYGFIKAVRKMMRDFAPDAGAVIWDEGLPERRTTLQADYKAQRPEMPEKLRVQLPVIRRIVPALGLADISVPNTEADDLIAVYSREAERLGWESALATNDKDLFQLVSEKTRIYSTNKADVKDAGADFALLGPLEVESKWGVPPAQIGEVLALTGDSVDNIPGIPGVGEKTAVKLIREYGTVENLLTNAERIANPRLREAVMTHRENVLQNREMVALDFSLSLPVPLKDMMIRTDYPELVARLRECEFRSMLAEVEKEAAAARKAAAPQGTQGELFA